MCNFIDPKTNLKCPAPSRTQAGYCPACSIKAKGSESGDH